MSYRTLLQDDAQYPVYPQRFLVTGLFGLIQMMTSILMNTINPIAAALSVIYQYKPLAINLGGLLYILMHPIFTFPAAYVIDQKGVKTGIIVGSVLGLLGIGCRLLVNEVGFWTVIVGQILGGIGRPFILNCQAKISANWFRASNRAGVTQLLTLIVNVSLIVGILIPGLIFSGFKYQAGNPHSVEQGKSLTFKLMLIEAILGLVCFLPNIIFQIQKPPQPPSQSGYLPRQPFVQALKKIFKMKSFMLLLIAFGLYFGVFNAISIVLGFMLEPWFGKSTMATTLVGSSPIISGIIGVIVLGPLQRKSKKFKKWIIICMIGSTSAMVLFYPMLQTNLIAIATLVSAYNSFFLIPLVPMMLQLGCELAYPVGEGTAVGLLFAVGNLFGFLFGSIQSLIVKGETKAQTAYGLILNVGLFVIGLVLIIIAKQDLKRVKAQRQSSERRSKQSIITTDQARNIETDFAPSQSQQPCLNESLIVPSQESQDAQKISS